jgi:hypothetical protein
MGEDSGRQEALGRPLDASQAGDDNLSLLGISAVFSPLRLSAIRSSRELAAIRFSTSEDFR